mmetsp:Transcript_75385/g.117843  ORF Transcript_75385/g.117843 Transcript_75385/m.117843 type:complete len:216 (+) Transcript_75385:71-718(+)
MATQGAMMLAQMQPVQIQASQPQVQYMPAVQPQTQVQYIQQTSQGQPQVQYIQQTPQAQPQLQYVQQSPQAQPQVQYLQQTPQAQPQVQYVHQTPLYQPQGQMIQSQQQVSYTPAQMQYVQQLPMYQPQGQIAQPAVSQQAEAIVKLEIGDWYVCEDSLGEFYHHAPSGQSFDQAPAQLVALIQASQRPQVQIASPTVGLQAYGQQVAGNVQYVV